VKARSAIALFTVASIVGAACGSCDTGPTTVPSTTTATAATSTSTTRPEADVGDYLPFPVRDPEYPETVVTSEMLLTHQAGLANTFPDSTFYDNDDIALEWAAENLDFDLSASPYLEGRPSHAEYVESYFLPGGENAGAEIWIDEPGARMQYSNLGLAHLVPYLIEEVSGEAWTDYIDGHILEPLGMTETSFNAGDFTETRLAVPHTRVEGDNLALPITGMNASGKLRTTVPDLARFLASHMNAGRLNGAVILQPESVKGMHEEHLSLRGDDWAELTFDGEGLGWWLWLPDLEGHGGHVPGYSARMMMSEQDAGAYGIVLMLNVGCSLQCDEDWYNDHVVAIRELLLDEASALHAKAGE
jgi:CubicO group peptidase (beta-lactamase class C family)